MNYLEVRVRRSKTDAIKVRVKRSKSDVSTPVTSTPSPSSFLLL